MPVETITSPDHPELTTLCSALDELAHELDVRGSWPAEQLRLCGECGVYQWFLSSEWGGQDWDDEQVVRGYLALSAACLTTTFILTQRTGACRRIASCENHWLKHELLSDLARGDLFATVGISHLTTSRQHVAKPVLQARRIVGGFELNGFSPWVTGAAHAQYVVTGATLMEGTQPSSEQILVALPTDLPGVSTPPPEQLVGVSSSHTGKVQLNDVLVEEKWLLAGPIENVMSQGIGAGTGGYQTSALAVGLAGSAISFLESEATRREDLKDPCDALREDYQNVFDLLMAVVRNEPGCSGEQLRQRANSLVLRAAQAALVTAKGTGYVCGHPAGRWCREALFFLVWSCPQPVVSANLCELAGIAE